MCNLHWLGSSERTLQSKCLVSHLARLGLFALHLQLMSFCKVVIDSSLQSLAIYEAPLPLVAALTELVPGDQVILICVPFSEEALIFGLAHSRNFTNSTLIDCKSTHHLNEVIFANSFSARCIFPEHRSDRNLLPFCKSILRVFAELGSIFGFL